MEYTRTTQQSVAWFRSRENEGSLDKRPPFQRLFVWSRRQQSSLIETILLNYPIPEIYMQEGLTTDDQERYVIVDGQQRIRTVLEFVDGILTLDDQTLTPYAGASFDELTETSRRQVLQYQFVVRVLPADWAEEKLRDIFSRLNRGVSALNDQELRHATYWGPFITTMEDLAQDERWDSMRVFTANDVRRMLDVEYVSELAIAALHGHQNKKDTLDEYYLLYEEYFEPEDDIREIFNQTLRALEDVFAMLESRRWRKKSDFYTLFCIIAQAPEDWAQPALRGQLSEALDEFAELVDSGLSRIGRSVRAIQSGEDLEEEASLTELPDEIASYTLAVRGAASDKAARVTRHDALKAWLARRVGEGQLRASNP